MLRAKKGGVHPDPTSDVAFNDLAVSDLEVYSRILFAKVLRVYMFIRYERIRVKYTRFTFITQLFRKFNRPENVMEVCIYVFFFGNGSRMGIGRSHTVGGSMRKYFASDESRMIRMFFFLFLYTIRSLATIKNNCLRIYYKINERMSPSLWKCIIYVYITWNFSVCKQKIFLSLKEFQG